MSDFTLLLLDWVVFPLIALPVRGVRGLRARQQGRTRRGKRREKHQRPAVPQAWRPRPPLRAGWRGLPPRPATAPTVHLVDGPLVRPYVLHVRAGAAERRRQARRRRVLWLATVGIDIAPRRMHGVRVPGGTR